VDLLRKLTFEAVLDGKIVVLDDEGLPDFQMLQYYGKSASGRLVYYVFDLLYFQGHDLIGLPLVKRKVQQQKVLPAIPGIRFSDHVLRDGVLFYRVVKEKGLEGIIAKYAASGYQMGRRIRQWLKVKRRSTQEGVIAGFTAPRGGRKYFGALVLGVFEDDELIFIGRSGGGFGAKVQKEIYEKMESLIREESPFRVPPKTNAPVTWLKHELVCESSFSGWTADGVMRHPVFLRLREDKVAGEVMREILTDKQ
jgi:bifunctional non-homologous end joining protein LigD